MSNEGNIKASILLILLKCIVVGYSNGNESFTGRLFSNYGPLNMLFHFFRYLIYIIVFFTRLLSKSLWNYPFSAQISKSISRYSILQKIRMSNFVILKWRPFEYKVKNLPVFGAVFSEIKKCWHFEFSWIKYFGNDFSFLIKWHIWVYYCWNYGPSNLKAELKADFWLQIGIYSRKNCPRHGSGQLPPANS